MQWEKERKRERKRVPITHLPKIKAITREAFHFFFFCKQDLESNFSPKRESREAQEMGKAKEVRKMRCAQMKIPSQITIEKRRKIDLNVKWPITQIKNK